MTDRILQENGTDAILLEDASGVLIDERTGYSQMVLRDLPIAYFRLGEPSGSVMNDETGNHDGVYVGSPTFGASGVGNDGDTAITLNGSGTAYGEVTNWLTITGYPASIEAWIKHDGVDFTLDVTIAGSVNPGVRALRIMAKTLDADTMELGIYTEQGNSHYNWTPAGSTDWHHLVGAIEADGTCKVHFDGVEVGSVGATTYTAGAVTEPFRIGTGTDAGVEGTESWPGGLDEVAVYDYELLSARVVAHYNEGLPVVGGSALDPMGMTGFFGA
jgi:hypothetical protein